MKWRHWYVLTSWHHTSITDSYRGCVTPEVLRNWADTANGDMELIDGYDLLPADAQEKVKRALEQGHVDDDDWNGVCAFHSVHLLLLTCV